MSRNLYFTVAVAFVAAAALIFAMPLCALGEPFNYQAQTKGVDGLTAAPITSGSDAASHWTKFVVQTKANTVPTTLILPNTASTAHPAPLLILIHGLNMSGNMMTPMAQGAAQSGYASVVVDMPYALDQQPKTLPTYTSVSAATGAISTMITESVDDLGCVLNYADKQPDVDPTRVAVIGISMGAIVGTDFAAVDPRVKAVMLIAGGGDLGSILKSVAASNKPYAAPFAALLQSVKPDDIEPQLKAVDPLTYVAQIAPRPLLMENGAADPIIPPSAAKALYDAAGQPKHIDWYPGEGHIPSPLALYAALTVFLEQHLPVSASVAH